jgi:hypothetical protein
MSDERITVPMLSEDGSNWVNYRDRISVILRHRKLYDHFTSDVPTPRYVDAGDIDGQTPQMRWDDDEVLAKIVLNSSLPDSVYTQVKDSANIKSTWDALITLFQGRSRNLILDLGTKLQFTQCGDDENIHTHFIALTKIRQKLAAYEQNHPR